MKPTTLRSINRLRSLCLAAAPQTRRLILSGLQRLRDEGRNAEETDALEAIAGFKWKAFDNSGNQIAVYDAFPQHEVEDDIEAMPPDENEFPQHLQQLSLHQVAALLGTVIAAALNIAPLGAGMLNFNTWAPKMEAALIQALK